MSVRTKGPVLFVDRVFQMGLHSTRDFVLTVLEKCPVDGKYWAAYLCHVLRWQAESLTCLLQSLKYNHRDPLGLMFTWIRPVSLWSSSTWPLLPSNVSGDMPCVLFLSCYPFGSLVGVFFFFWPWAPTCRNFLTWSKGLNHTPLLFSNFLYLISLPSVPSSSSLLGWEQTGNTHTRTQTHTTAAECKSGERGVCWPCSCVSKVRLPCRMLSFSWLTAGRRGSRWRGKPPLGWCVKRYGRTGDYQRSWDLHQDECDLNSSLLSLAKWKEQRCRGGNTALSVFIWTFTIQLSTAWNHLTRCGTKGAFIKAFCVLFNDLRKLISEQWLIGRELVPQTSRLGSFLMAVNFCITQCPIIHFECRVEQRKLGFYCPLPEG